MKSNIEQRWLSEALPFFRRLEFFDAYRDTSDVELAKVIIDERESTGQPPFGEILSDIENDKSKIREEWQLDMPDYFFFTPPAMADMVLVAEDRTRVWWDDGETDIWLGGDIYKRAVEEWSRISRSAFLPINTKELWAEKDGPMCVSIILKGKEHRLIPKQAFGWIDFFGMLTQINSLIEESGFRFEMQVTDDQTTFIVVLTADEKRKLEAERGWEFYEL